LECFKPQAVQKVSERSLEVHEKRNAIWNVLECLVGETAYH
jgi:hypothetical protein